MKGSWRTCGCCSTLIRSALQLGKKNTEDIYFSALGAVTCWRGEKCLHFLDIMTFGCELFAKVFYRLQACAFANGFLFLDALRPLPYK